MRTLIYLILLLAINDSIIASTQDSTYESDRVSFIIKADILVPIIELLEKRTETSLTFETCFKHRQSIQLTGLLDHFNENVNSYAPDAHTIKDNSFQTILEYKFFISKKKDFSGFYTGAYLHYLYFSNTNQEISVYPSYSYSISYIDKYIGGGLILGYQNYFKKRWVYDAIIGLGTRKLLSKKVNEEINVPYDSIEQTESDGRVAINIGYKF